MASDAPSRPINLALTKFKFPVTAIVSITHRLTGIGLFFGSLYMIFLLVLSLRSEETFAQVAFLLSLPIHKAIVWLIVSMVLFHFVAGIRHLLHDVHIGSSLAASRVSAFAVFIVAGLLSIFVGMWLFL